MLNRRRYSRTLDAGNEDEAQAEPALCGRLEVFGRACVSIGLKRVINPGLVAPQLHPATANEYGDPARSAFAPGHER